MERVQLDASFVLLLHFLVHIRFAPLEFLISKQPASVDTVSIAILDPQIMLIIMGKGVKRRVYHCDQRQV